MPERPEQPESPGREGGLEALPEVSHEVVLNISKALGESKNLPDLVAVVRSELSKLIDTRNFFLALYDDKEGTYTFPYFVDEYDDLRTLGPQKLARSLTDYVRRSGRSLLVDDEQHRKLIRAGEVELVGTPSPVWLGVPLRGTGRVLGIMAVQSYSRRTLYSQSDLLLLDAISRHIGLTIERKQAEEDLFESEQRFRSFVAALGDGILFHDGSEVLDANDEAARMSGYELSELLGASPLMLVVPEDRPMVAEEIQKAGERHFEVMGLRKDGSTLPLSVRARDVPYRGLEVRVVLFRDITDRRRALQALKESEERYRSLFESSQEAIFISSADGILEDVNPAAVELFGYSSKQELIAADLADEIYVNPRDRGNLRELLHAQGKIKDYELRLKTKQGKHLVVLETSELLRGADGQAIGGRGLLRDVTESRELERQFLQAQKMEAIGRLAGGIAHDFNNLLVVINGYADLLAGQLSRDDPRRGDFEAIRDAGKRATDLVAQLSAFSRQQVLHPRVLDLNQVVGGFLALVTRALGEDIKVRLNPSPSPGRVMADVGQLEQVLMNLAVNARDAMPDGGELLIKTWNAELEKSRTIGGVEVRPGQYCVIAVSDTGVGIDEEQIDHLFDPFFTTKETGTGLGLSTAYGIVKQSGGYIWASSERGEGTTFTVYLPRVDAEPEVLQDEAESLELGGSESVLVVDDDRGVRAFVRQALEGFGYSVLTAADAEEALAICRDPAQKIDVLLTDCVMPGMNGMDLAEVAGELRPRMGIVLMTGYNEQSHDQASDLEPGVSLLQKPFSAEAVARKVKSKIQRGATTDQKRNDRRSSP